MKAIVLMFDSLNRRHLPPYGCDWVHAPNFQRLAERTVTFTNSYIGSMPCMPARRELHTGRYNFLHRSWGPLEPFDDSMPELLTENGVYTHLITDHQHYFEDGGASYHERYNSWEFLRGQEGDPWIGRVAEPDTPEELIKLPPNMPRWVTNLRRQDWINRAYMTDESMMPQAQTFSRGLEFIEANHDQDNWFLQLETFDPHEPFFAPQKYKDLYPHDYAGPHFDWPPYRQVEETPEQIDHMRYEYAALLSMCDAYLGKVLDLMDELNLWNDTMLIVNTDHGFLLGEHDWWAKMVQPLYQEVAHTPLFIWDPRCRRQGERCDALVQTIDLPATLLEFFGVDRPPDMQGVPLRDAIAHDTPVRTAALFGGHGSHVNVTDGRYVYMRGAATAENSPLYEYTLMPTHMRMRFNPAELQETEMVDAFSFMKGCRVMKIPARGWRTMNPFDFGTLLYDVADDPQQLQLLDDPAVEQQMVDHLLRLMRENDAPAEQYERLGLSNV